MASELDAQSEFVSTTSIPLKAESAIAQIRTAIRRYRTSRDAMDIENRHHTSTDELDESDSTMLTPGILKTDGDVLNEVEQVISSLESTGLYNLGYDHLQANDFEPVDAVQDARWQSRARIPLETQTHPKSFAPYTHHIEDLKSFKDDLLAAKKCSEVTKPTYTKVEVLLLTWEESDMMEEIEEEASALTKLFDELNYEVTEIAIPNIDCQNELQLEVLTFLRRHKKNPPGETLIIVYYTGHGSIRNESCYWHPTKWAASPSDRNDRNSRQNGPTVDWAKIQENFEQVKQDVLFILDCCYAGSAALHKGPSGTKELLAACGSEDQTPAGPESFTHRLIDCIKRLLKEEPLFQVSWLYESMIQASQSPLCLHVNLNRSPLSISLSSLAENTNPDFEAAIDESTDGYLVPPSPSRARSPSSATSSHVPSLFSGKDESDNTTQISTPDPYPVLNQNWHYKVLLSIKLRANILPTAEDWCLTFPPGQVEGLEDVTFQSLYPTKSTLLFLTMPVRQWVLLKDNPAYTFIDFVEGDNFMHTHSHALPPPGPEPAVHIAPVERTNSDESTSTTGVNETEAVVGYLLAAMHDFFQKTKSQEEKLVRRPGKITRTCQYIAENLGVPSRLESDPRFAIVQHIVQHLNINRNDQGDSIRLRYGLQLDVLVDRMLETKSSIKDAIHRSHDKNGDIDNTINTEFSQLEKSIVKLAELENEDLVIRKFMESPSPPTFDAPKSAMRKQTTFRTRSDVGHRHSVVTTDSGVGFHRRNSTKTRTGSWRSKLGSARSDSATSSSGRLALMEVLKRRFSRESRPQSPRGGPHITFTTV